LNKITLAIITFLVAAGSVLSACTAKGTSADLTGTSWKLISYGTAGNQTPAAPGIETSLTFGKYGQASGNLGCNSFSGDYEVKDGSIVFGLLASTLMECPEPQMTQEGTVFQVMIGTVRFEAAGNTLTIYDASGAIAITLSRIEK
jgi:heat shock protein HslJ